LFAAPKARLAICTNVPVTESLLERQKADEVDHLAKPRKILHTILDLLQAVTDSIGLVDDLEDRIAHRAFVQKIVGHGASFARKSEGDCEIESQQRG